MPTHCCYAFSIVRISCIGDYPDLDPCRDSCSTRWLWQSCWGLKECFFQRTCGLVCYCKLKGLFIHHIPTGLKSFIRFCMGMLIGRWVIRRQRSNHPVHSFIIHQDSRIVWLMDQNRWLPCGYGLATSMGVRIRCHKHRQRLLNRCRIIRLITMFVNMPCDF